MRKLLERKGFTFVRRNPDFAISMGGDGTFLFCENKYPSVPKLLISDSRICKKCVGDNEETILDFIRLNAFDVREELKIEGSFGNKKLIAVNDILIRNNVPNQALRFALYINGEKKYSEIIGDGLLIATPFGSTAYYNSITRTSFKKGIGVAFNNPVEKHNPLLLKENAVIRIKVLRGDAQLAFDNHRKIYKLKQNCSLIVKKADDVAKIISIEGF